MKDITCKSGPQSVQSEDVSSQLAPPARRGFLKAFGIVTASAAVAAAVAVPVHAGPVLTARQCAILEQYEQLDDFMQLHLITMAKEYAKTFPRHGEPMSFDDYVKSVGVNEGAGTEQDVVTDRLSKQEHAVIQAFRNMDDRARRTVTRLAKRNAAEWPRHAAPELRLVAGGAA